MKRFRIPAVLSFFFLLSWFFSCKKGDLAASQPEPEATSSIKKDWHGFTENDMVLYWNQKASLVVTGPFSPPAQSRYFAMIQIAVHDALNSIKPKYKTYALHDHRVKNASPDAAVASAAYHAILKLGLKSIYPLDDWYNESLNKIPGGESKELGITLGETAATFIYNNRANDNFVEANKQLPGPDGTLPGQYRSTLPFSNPGMPKIKALHQWGTLMLPFVIQNNYQFRPTPPYPIASINYVNDYNEVKTKGGRVGHTRTQEEDEIGKFWVERSSIGWNRFAVNMISEKNMDAWKTARLLALLHTAMTDAITACFEAKYHYFYWRPETAIRLGNEDDNALTTGDGTWLPSYTETPTAFINTPPIPDYPSAHAAFGGAAAAILTKFFDSDMVNVDQTSPTLQNVTRHYTSIAQAARDNSLSRIYVGYHFRYAVIKGEEQGMAIGNYIFENSFKESE